MLDWTRCSGQLSRAQETRTTSGSMQASTNHQPLVPWPVQQSSSHPLPIRLSFCPSSVLFFPFVCPFAPTSFICVPPVCPSAPLLVLLLLRLFFSALPLSFCPSACPSAPPSVFFCLSACPSASPSVLLPPQSVILIFACLPVPPLVLQPLSLSCCHYVSFCLLSELLFLRQSVCPPVSPSVLLPLSLSFPSVMKCRPTVHFQCNFF
jgi:hypothetical protein